MKFITLHNYYDNNPLVVNGAEIVMCVSISGGTRIYFEDKNVGVKESTDKIKKTLENTVDFVSLHLSEGNKCILVKQSLILGAFTTDKYTEVALTQKKYKPLLVNENTARIFEQIKYK